MPGKTHDLVPTSVSSRALTAPEVHQLATERWEIRLDLGGGIVLHLARG